MIVDAVASANGLSSARHTTAASSSTPPNKYRTFMPLKKTTLYNEVTREPRCNASLDMIRQKSLSLPPPKRDSFPLHELSRFYIRIPEHVFHRENEHAFPALTKTRPLPQGITTTTAATLPYGVSPPGSSRLCSPAEAVGERPRLDAVFLAQLQLPEKSLQLQRDALTRVFLLLLLFLRLSLGLPDSP